MQQIKKLKGQIQVARKTLYERIDSLGVNVSLEYEALIKLLKFEESIFQYRFYTLLEYIDKNYFRELPANFRSPYLSANDMMKDLGLGNTSYTMDNLFLLAEFCVAILPHEHITQREDLYKQAKTIFTNISSFLEKLNYEFIEIDGERKIIVEKNHAVTQAVEIVNDNATAIALIEYNHYALKGYLDEKRKILTALGSYIEPILKSRSLQNAGYKQLESDVGFMLNNFHVRHNNKEGAKAQDYITGLDKKQLEEWYDRIYNAILSVIIINDHIPVQNNIADLKSKYTWRP